ncbi:DVUA0089 family protein [Myxococcota bacterium]|nr:DVUA0089 family protein [Myxococcota bacterium]
MNARKSSISGALLVGATALAACGGGETTMPLPDAGIVVVPGPEITSFTASRTSVTAGESVVLAWAVETSTAVTITREVAGAGMVLLETTALTGTISSGRLVQSSTFRLVAEGKDATISETVAVDVVVPELTIHDFTATPSPAEQVSDVTISWDVEGATRVRVLDGSTVLKDTTTDVARGSVSLRVVQGPRNLLLEASSEWHTRTRSLVLYTRDHGRIVSFGATPAVFAATSTTVTLRWDTRGEEIHLQSDGADVPGASPDALVSELAVMITEPELFTLTASGLGRTAIARRAVVPRALPEREPNDTAAQAQLVTAGMLGRIERAGDVDHYRVRVPAGGNLFVELTDARGGCGVDLGVRIVDPNGAEVVERDAGERGPCARIDPLFDPLAAGLAGGDYLVIVDGRDAGARYGLAVIVGESACGNGLVERPIGEQCDDGDETPGDGCSATCTLEVTDAGVLPGPAILLAGALAAGDVDYHRLELGAPMLLSLETGVPLLGACDPGADTYLELYDATMTLLASDDDALGLCAAMTPVSSMPLAAGTYFVAVRAFDASSVIAAYELGASELQLVCGDGVLAPGESCDDGNLADGDGCSATCTAEVVPPPGGRFSLELAAGAVRSIDVEVTMPGQSITATTSDGMGGCAVDTRLVLARDGNYLGWESGGNSCARFSGRTHPWAADLEPGIYRVFVLAEGATGGAVTLDVGIEDPRCGNGIREVRVAEQCDDGNAVDGDGCSTICRREVSATAYGPSPTPFVFPGALVLSGDEELFGIEMSAPGSISVEVGVPVMEQCTGADPVAELYDIDMVMIAMNDDSNGLCSFIDPANDPGARVAAGSYILLIRHFNRVTPIPAYEVRITLTGYACGNGILETGETCDDGNTSDGDGCSATCTFDGTTLVETEPNDELTTATSTTVVPGGAAVLFGAALEPAGDVDYYRFTIPAGVTTAIRTWTQTDPIDEQVCDRIDTYVTLLDANGTAIIEDDDDGAGNCSLIDGTGTTPRDVAAAFLTEGTYYLHVRPFAQGSAIPAYFLGLRIQ